LDFVHSLSSILKAREHNVSETGSVIEFSSFEGT
jgi:hypothetical protein